MLLEFIDELGKCNGRLAHPRQLSTLPQPVFTYFHRLEVFRIEIYTVFI